MSVAEQQLNSSRGLNIGGAMKTSEYWLTPNVGATNSSGFSALPAAERLSSGPYVFIDYYGGWWSSTTSTLSPTYAWTRRLNYSDSEVTRMNVQKKGSAISVRCVRD